MIFKVTRLMKIEHLVEAPTQDAAMKKEKDMVKLTVMAMQPQNVSFVELERKVEPAFQDEREFHESYKGRAPTTRVS